MGKRGPRPKPSALKILEGNPGHRPIDIEHEMQPAKPDVPPKAPKHVTGEARKEWDRAVAELYPVGLITNLDLGMLEGLCLAKGRALKAELSIARDGILITVEPGSRGRPAVKKTNPAVRIAKDSWAQYRQYCQEFGLSPSARVRVRVPEDRKAPGPPPAAVKDTNAEFLFGRVRRA